MTWYGLDNYTVADAISTHTLTWSVTDGLTGDLDGISDFNSHAHVERDCILRVLLRLLLISTHTLTWSVTKIWIFNLIVSDISTHTLTWSVTVSSVTLYPSSSNISTHTLTWSVTIFVYCFIPP